MDEATEHILTLIRNDPWRMEILSAVRALALPDWAIGAGFVRAAVWDAYCGFSAPTPLGDIDVIYFDRCRMNSAIERRHERQLQRKYPAIPWSVKNQARMHHRNGDLPYQNTVDAIAHWLEMPTCIAVRLSDSGHLDLIAPHGTHDLISCRTRPTPVARRKMAAYDHRLNTKGWRKKWPELKVYKV